MSEDIQKLFKEIYDKESDAIFRFCLMRVSDRDQALDITQEVFMRLWNNLIEKKKITNYRAFIFTITRNLIIDWYRKKKSVSLDQMIDDEQERFDVVDGSITNNLELSFEGKNVLEKISELSETYQTSVYLRFVEDMSPKEISAIIGLSENVVSVRINRGIEELRNKMGYK